MYKKEIKNIIYARNYKAMNGRNLKERKMVVHMWNTRSDNKKSVTNMGIGLYSNIPDQIKLREILIYLKWI
jgi:hypothetical protein